MAEVKYLDKTGLGTVWSKVKGIVTPKADKVSGATAGHLAGLNSGGNLTDSGLAATNVAQKDGSYSGMTVGAAEDLVSAESVASEFTSRITGGSTAVGKGGTALVDKIKGRTLVWNQLVRNSYINLTLEGTKSNNNIAPGLLLSLVSGHKYYVRCAGNIIGNMTLRFRDETLSHIGSSFLPNSIVVASITSNNTTLVQVSQSDVTNTFYFNIYDLTLMFGGNEPSTPEEFEALYPGPYYDYNPGTLISNAATAIETVGWNIWDEEVEVGGIDTSTGENTSGSNRLRSASFTPIIGGQSYYMYCGSGAYAVGYFYDKNKQFISYLGAGSFSNKAFSAPDSARYLRIALGQNYGTTYKNDICISLSDPSRNGTYEPYWRSELELNIPTLTGKLNGTGNSVVIFPDGLRSAGTVYDEIVGNKAIKRIGAVNLGSLTWDDSVTAYYQTNSITNMAQPASNNTVFNNMVTSKGYTPVSAITMTSNDKCMAVWSTSKRFGIRDTNYATLAAFTTAMSGVMLYYELATPEEYILDEAIPTAMRNDPYGTERRLPEDTAGTVLAPFRADITYSTNIKEAVQSLPQNYINVNSMQDFLAELGTLMGGTWTMRPADGKFDFTFTPNPSNE